MAIAPSADAAEEWATRVTEHSPGTMAVLGCTPGYYNAEGDIDRVPPERRAVVARSGIWGRGSEDFVAVIEAWREEGSMRGIEVRT